MEPFEGDHFRQGFEEGSHYYEAGGDDANIHFDNGNSHGRNIRPWESH